MSVTNAPNKPSSCMYKRRKNYSCKKQEQQRFHERIQAVVLPFSLTRWSAGGRGRRLAKPGHRCPQTSAGGTQQSLAWLVGLRRFSRHDTHLLQKNRIKDAADPPTAPQESLTTMRLDPSL